MSKLDRLDLRWKLLAAFLLILTFLLQKNLGFKIIELFILILLFIFSKKKAKIFLFSFFLFTSFFLLNLFPPRGLVLFRLGFIVIAKGSLREASHKITNLMALFLISRTLINWQSLPGNFSFFSFLNLALQFPSLIQKNWKNHHREKNIIKRLDLTLLDLSIPDKKMTAIGDHQKYNTMIWLLALIIILFIFFLIIDKAISQEIWINFFSHTIPTTFYYCV